MMKKNCKAAVLALCCSYQANAMLRGSGYEHLDMMKRGLQKSLAEDVRGYSESRSAYVDWLSKELFFKTIATGDAARVKKLFEQDGVLAEGFDIQAVDERGENALFYAPNMRMARLLMRMGVRCTANKKGLCPYQAHKNYYVRVGIRDCVGFKN